MTCLFKISFLEWHWIYTQVSVENLVLISLIPLFVSQQTVDFLEEDTKRMACSGNSSAFRVHFLAVWVQRLSLPWSAELIGLIIPVSHLEWSRVDGVHYSFQSFVQVNDFSWLKWPKVSLLLGGLENENLQNKQKKTSKICQQDIRPCVLLLTCPIAHSTAHQVMWCWGWCHCFSRCWLWAQEVHRFECRHAWLQSHHFIDESHTGCFMLLLFSCEYNTVSIYRWLYQHEMPGMRTPSVCKSEKLLIAKEVFTALQSCPPEAVLFTKWTFSNP